MIESTSQSYSLMVMPDDDLKGKRIVAGKTVHAGETIAPIVGYEEVNAPSKYTVQISAHRHIDGLGLLTYLNHSCDPNVIVNTTSFAVIAIRDIAMGEELSFFYPSTEWRMATPFACLCGTASCVGVIDGAEQLSDETLSHYFLNEHIQELRR